MARKKTRLTPSKFGVNEALIQVRNATKRKTQTQRGFAQAVGINPSTYQKTEEGHRLLEFDEAVRIMSYTGADAKSLIKGRKAKTLNKRNYSNAAFKQWRERPVDAGAVRMSAKKAGLLAEALVRASYRENASRYRVVVEKLFGSLGEIERDFDLTTVLGSELQEGYAEKKEVTMTWAEFKRFMHLERGKDFPKGWDVEKAARVPASMRLKVEQVEYPVFERMAGGSFGKEAFTYDAVTTSRVVVRVKLPWSSGKWEFTRLKCEGFIALSGKSAPFKMSLNELK
jgi:transcriptional regulator with XRE-family HTH domain